MELEAHFSMQSVVRKKSVLNPGSLPGGFLVTRAQLKAASDILAQVDLKGYTPPNLGMAPMPGPKPAAVGAVPAVVPNGTPGDPALFTSFPFSTVGKVIYGRVTPGGGRQQEGW